MLSEAIKDDMASIRASLPPLRASNVTISRGNTPSVSNDRNERKPGSEFKEKYRQGFKLTSSTAADTPICSTGPAEGKSSIAKGYFNHTASVVGFIAAL
jgi:hypothetical protein